ncbi:hypothetical protein NE683_02075 [Bariatricus massiliensis]|uniref:Uncharacterized protein n=1 Tax=Bariatricus massiliensis TaxID=1745713 RepID=A0ABS8DMV0_9FIRM|nr:hypothetical protein [Bariatricus massiliensis]MCB7303132.1 hypothetical protein [Bariatricus massiliensis]MCB7374348.1 hypothetical protein [Bariatricus massiliensis]MCB7389569.1 hypothetical protein [Bariatricus massiliensis]MCB7413726.1 hypothetical protein [Bariatricus massiliensis]MCQ5252006.1 hypothetical protein [Bariatricus massiliensis]
MAVIAGRMGAIVAPIPVKKLPSPSPCSLSEFTIAVISSLFSSNLDKFNVASATSGETLDMLNSFFTSSKLSKLSTFSIRSKIL